VKLAEAQHGQPLFDTAAYTRNLEAIYVEIRKRKNQTGTRFSF
jgi:hypothetical protein